MKKGILLIAVLAAWFAVKNPAYVKIMSSSNHTTAVKINQLTTVASQQLFHTAAVTNKAEQKCKHVFMPRLIIRTAQFSQKAIEPIGLNYLLAEMRLPIMAL
jgi:hypothetical protein